MTADTDAWSELENRFARALTAWGFTDPDEAAPYARSVVRNLKADGWRAPARPVFRRTRRADPADVPAYAEQCRAAIRRHRDPVDAA